MKLRDRIGIGGKKGITIIWLALFMLPLLIMLAGIAIDIAYMYNVKNQLHVAADAAALAGAGLLGDKDDLSQASARVEAVIFANKNTAAGAPVILGDGGAGNNTLSGLNDNPGNDMTVGNWDGTAYHPNQTPVNAFQVRTRRTANSPGGSVRVFWGQIFKFIGGDWSFMNAVATATASYQVKTLGPFPICVPSCSRNTPLDGQWAYDKTEDDPILCTDQDGSPPGQLFLFESSSEAEPVKPGLAWTNFATTACSGVCDQPSGAEVLPYLQGALPPPICDKNVCTTNGTIANLFEDVQEQFDKNKQQYTITVGTTPVTITGWKMIIPVVDFSCVAPGNACPGSPDHKATPYHVSQFARVILTEVVKPKGFRFVALDNPRQLGPQTVNCKKGPITVNRMVTSIAASGTCENCADLPPPSSGFTRPVLVR
jgi:Flp pilus assembly protein TadG